MKKYFYIGLFVLAVAGVVGLFFYKTSPPTEPAAQTADFGGVSLRLDYATTTAARERGLGGRDELAGDYGMLFVFPKEERYGFWMKDMLVPIDMFWLDSKGQVVSIAESVAPSTYPNVFYPSAPALYVLETTAGFAQTHSIIAGTPLMLKNFPTVTK